MTKDKMRALFEDERKRHPKGVKIEINTRVPSKWRFVDLETGDIWRRYETGGFKRADDIEIKNLLLTPTPKEQSRKKGVRKRSKRGLSHKV